MKKNDYLVLGALLDKLIKSSEKVEDRNIIRFNKIHDLINECGYEVRSEQRGILGSFIYLVPIENK